MAPTQLPTMTGPALGRWPTCVLLIVLVASAALGQSGTDGGGTGMSQQETEIDIRTETRYCGQHLVDVVNLVCAALGGIYSPPSTKRTSGGYIFRTWLGQRQRRGIVQECCTRACTMFSMRRYCTVPIMSNSSPLLSNNAADSNSVLNEDVTTTRRPATTTTTTTTAATTTSAASPYGGIYSRTTSAHGRIPISNEQYFPVPNYYRQIRDFNAYGPY